LDNAYKIKKQKEAEAQQLLDSIDEYVLYELGIKLPIFIDKMCFSTYSDKIKGRLDPKKYSEKPKAIRTAVNRSKFNTILLSDLVVESISGEWGFDPNFNVQNDENILCKVIRNTNFDNNFNLDLTNVAKRIIPKNRLSKIRLKKGDLLIEKSGGSPIQPVGRISLIEQVDDVYTFSNFLQKIRIKTDLCLPQYLFTYLKSIYRLNYMEYLQNQTIGIKNLIMEEYLSIKISLPPIKIQNKMAEEVKRRMQKAERLQKEAKQLLQEAKEKVENMILSE
jgi:restriction endonuclease S subunit